MTAYERELLMRILGELEALYALVKATEIKAVVDIAMNEIIAVLNLKKRKPKH